jgi:hypothetical protein
MSSRLEHTRSNDRQAHYVAVKSCFNSLLRDAALGKMHVNKGIYIDQLQRWFLNFPPQNFLIVSLEQFELYPQDILGCILQFMSVPLHERLQSRRKPTKCQLWGSNTTYWNCCEVVNKGDVASDTAAIAATDASISRKSYTNTKLLSNANWRRNFTDSADNSEKLRSILNHTLYRFYLPYEDQLQLMLGRRWY